MKGLEFVGRHAGSILLCSLVVVAFLPGVSAVLRPWLPALVSLVLGLAIARLDVGAIVRDVARPRRLAMLVGFLILFLPVTCMAAVGLGRMLGFSADTILALAVFGASPPLSSAANLALMLGYNARITLQFGLLATLSLPILGPFCFALVGIKADIAAVEMAIRIALMIAGGFALGLTLQRIIGKARIAAQSEAFNGAATLAMIVFLFPLFDGVLGFVIAEPWQAMTLLILAIALNFGGHLCVVFAGKRITDKSTAQAAGLMFGNRNVSFYLAVLPMNPALGLFVAAAQIPIYATPAVFRRRR